MNTNKLVVAPFTAAFALVLLSAAPHSVAEATGSGHARGASATVQSAELFDFATLEAVQGGGVLERTRWSVRARLSTSGVDPHTAYSVWWVVFNRPSKCSDGACGEDDLFLPSGMPNEAGIEATGAGVFYADGFVTGADGVANVTAQLESGRLPVGTDALIPGMLRRGNGLRAEIHLVIRSHGPAVAGVVGLQTSTFGGYCDINVCADQQAIVFPPAY